MKQIKDPQDVKQLGKIMGIWAHPDDETFMTAGVMAAAVKNGQKVICVTATKGQAGQTSDEAKWPQARLGEIRAEELEDALKVLGVTEHYWLDYMDGDCQNVADEEVVPRLVELIKKYQPDTVVTFPPDGLTGHPDHQSACRWACKAVKQSGLPIQIYFGVDTQEKYDKYMKELDERFNVYFMVDHPALVPLNSCDISFELPDEICKLKVAAIKAQPSQTAGLSGYFNDDWFNKALKQETFVKYGRSDIKWNDYPDF